MTATATALGVEVLAHLDAQLASSRRLLDMVLRQGTCVRDRDVEGVLARLAEIRGEMDRRARLEADRGLLLDRAATLLGVTVGEVTLDRLVSLVAPDEAEAARTRSAELRGVLAEIGREHACNRALMRQELAFLDHLTRLVGRDAEPPYRPDGVAPAPPAASLHRVLDTRA